MTSSSSMTAMTFMVAPQREQRRGSTSYRGLLMGIGDVGTDLGKERQGIEHA
jgi:hypothetical protein